MKEVLPEMRHESWIPVRNDALGHAKDSNHMLQEQVYHLGCSDALMYRYQDNSLGSFVYYCHNTIEPM